MELFYQHPRIQGTCIWQYCDIRSEVELNRARSFNNKGIVNERATLSQNLANLQEKYDSLSARTTREARLKNLKISDCEKELAKAKHRIAELEGAMRVTSERLDSLSNTRLLLLIIVSVLTFGLFWVGYLIYYITAAPTYLSLKRWVACTKYVSPYVKK